jgi:integrase
MVYSLHELLICLNNQLHYHRHFSEMSKVLTVISTGTPLIVNRIPCLHKGGSMEESNAIIPAEVPAMDIGQVANQIARQTALVDYQARKSDQTLRRQKADIALFEQFLGSAGSPVEGLAYDLQPWSIITWGLVEAFNRWQLQQSYAVGSINVRLNTVKTYCSLAAKAGFLSTQELALVKTVAGYQNKEARNINEKRVQTRRPNAKKANPVSLAVTHAALLKAQPNTIRGRRDALIMCLLIDHSLRVSEVAALDISSINLQRSELTIYRQKTNTIQVHSLSPDTYKAALAYLADCPASGPLFVGICSKDRIGTRSINERVGQLGDALGIKGLSPHDCRHFFATDALRNGTDIKSLQDAGGWNSPAMPLRYAKSAKVANAGLKMSAYEISKEV